MNRLDELAGWASANEDELRAFVEQLDELVADRVPAAIELAEVVRAEKSRAYGEGVIGSEVARRLGRTSVPNPYEAEAGGS